MSWPKLKECSLEECDQNVVGLYCSLPEEEVDCDFKANVVIKEDNEKK